MNSVGGIQSFSLQLPADTRSNYAFQGWLIDGTMYLGNAFYDLVSSTSAVAQWKIVCPYSVGQTWSYDYTGGIQSFTTPCAGTYKLEVWGAAGGYDSHAGGLGGYSVGNKDLTLNQVLYIGIGGLGASGATGNGAGYNGGGNAGGSGSSGAGGGATHIATTNRGVLSAYSSYRSEVLIVAGGGGGGGNSISPIEGGTGGGVNGGSTGTSGGTQSSGYSFGQGQNHGSDGGGGGGGWYGGYAANGDGGGAGGSGYIGGVTSGSSSNGVRGGSGYATITLSTIAS
jgi:hypothetical protein